MRILLLEDEKKFAAVVSRGLADAGYGVDNAESCEDALRLVPQHDYDLMIVDVMLPDGSGLDVARRVRDDGYHGPVLMLTALSGTRDKVRGLDAGADDYLCKPFDLEELIARVRALLRRARRDSPALSFADVEMQLVTRRVTRAGEDLSLSAKEFALLEYLLRNPRRPLSRAEISENVWNLEFDAESNVIDVYINMLRKKLDAPFSSKLIHTVVGVGYVLREA